jgi:hypothetical protein
MGEELGNLVMGVPVGAEGGLQRSVRVPNEGGPGFANAWVVLQSLEGERVNNKQL